MSTRNAVTSGATITARVMGGPVLTQKAREELASRQATLEAVRAIPNYPAAALAATEAWVAEAAASLRVQEQYR